MSSIANIVIKHSPTDCTETLLNDLKSIARGENQHVINDTISLLLEVLAPAAVPLLSSDAGQDVDNLICDYHDRVLTYRQQIDILKQTMEQIVAAVKPAPPGSFAKLKIANMACYSYSKTPFHTQAADIFMTICINTGFIPQIEIRCMKLGMNIFIHNNTLLLSNYSLATAKSCRESNIKKFVSAASREIVEEINTQGNLLFLANINPQADQEQPDNT
jgi:hypothetical protein